MKYKKIVNFYACCEKWKPAKYDIAKFELKKEKACWTCYYNLFQTGCFSTGRCGIGKARTTQKIREG